jgi:hypothetical protein
LSRESHPDCRGAEGTIIRIQGEKFKIRMQNGREETLPRESFRVIAPAPDAKS